VRTKPRSKAKPGIGCKNHSRANRPADGKQLATIAGVKTELFLYHFIDGQLFRMTAKLPTDQFHLVSEAAVKKYGPPTRENQRPRQMIWENAVSSVILTRGSVHPREASVLELVTNSSTSWQHPRAQRLCRYLSRLGFS